MSILQTRIAVVGLPDSGKSRFIQEFIKYTTGRTLFPDTLMSEVHYSDGKDPYGNPDTRTIKAAKIFYNNESNSCCLIDCPGHLEYIDQIRQGVYQASFIVEIIDTKRYKESIAYINEVEKLCNIKKTTSMKIYARSNKKDVNHYNFDTKAGYERFIKLLKSIPVNGCEINLENEALERLKSIYNNDKISPAKDIFLFSGGKDSVVGLDILIKFCKKYNKELPRVLVPTSGYDFKEVDEFIESHLKKLNVKFERFDNSCGQKYGEVSNYQMMLNKAESNNILIKKELPEYVFVNYRASDEGVRSKDEWIKNFGFYSKISPVFNFSELDIWKYIKKHKLNVCCLYFKGYRSLGDESVTLPCMPHFTNVDCIIQYIFDNQQTGERDGRKGQDQSESFAMEKLRNVGFF